MSPLVLTEEEARTFNYYHGGKIQRGMIFQNKMYRLFRSFSVDERLKAYILGWRLCERRVQPVISVSSASCNVWIDLRSEVDI